MRAILGLWTFLFLASTAGWASVAPDQPGIRFIATAYSQRGQTASGAMTRVGLVAADPSVLPLGSVIQVRGAGPYSGNYTVADTGALVKGRHIDIFIPSF